MQWSHESFEDELLEAYWKKVGGVIYTEIPVGGSCNKWPKGSKIRRIDGVRIYGDRVKESKIVDYSNNRDEFKEIIKTNKIDIIEVKKN